MPILKSKTLQIFPQKAEQIQKIAGQATYQNRYNENYKSLYYGSEALLTELFSEKETMNFRRHVNSGVVAAHF